MTPFEYDALRRSLAIEALGLLHTEGFCPTLGDAVRHVCRGHFAATDPSYAIKVMAVTPREEALNAKGGARARLSWASTVCAFAREALTADVLAVARHFHETLVRNPDLKDVSNIARAEHVRDCWGILNRPSNHLPGEVTGAAVRLLLLLDAHAYNPEDLGMNRTALKTRARQWMENNPLSPELHVILPSHRRETRP